jgi:hypothetical protein
VWARENKDVFPISKPGTGNIFRFSLGPCFSEASIRAPNIAQNKIAKRSESEIFFAKNCEAKRSENIFRLCEAKRSEQFFKIAKNCEKLRNCEKKF